MAAPELPISVRDTLASSAVRWHHRLWHLVRSRAAWQGLPDDTRQTLIASGWQAPRFGDEEGSGLDFLYMHRKMIGMVNTGLAAAGDPAYPRVTGWDPIPANPADPDWPVPVWNASAADFPGDPNADATALLVNEAKSPQSLTQYQTLAAQAFRNPVWLATRSLDQLGTDIEWSVHGWMHIRWSELPPANPNSEDPANDWLFRPFSSHVNKVFWKLHGWIDERIADWEAASGQAADFTGAWEGPPGVLPPGMMLMHFHHAADLQLVDQLPDDLPNLPMLPRGDVVEGLLEDVAPDGL